MQSNEHKKRAGIFSQPILRGGVPSIQKRAFLRRDAKYIPECSKQKKEG